MASPVTDEKSWIWMLRIRIHTKMLSLLTHYFLQISPLPLPTNLPSPPNLKHFLAPLSYFPANFLSHQMIPPISSW